VQLPCDGRQCAACGGGVACGEDGGEAVKVVVQLRFGRDAAKEPAGEGAGEGSVAVAGWLAGTGMLATRVPSRCTPMVSPVRVMLPLWHSTR
jgi:hypothetical protein